MFSLCWELISNHVNIWFQQSHCKMESIAPLFFFFFSNTIYVHLQYELSIVHFDLLNIKRFKRDFVKRGKSTQYLLHDRVIESPRDRYPWYENRQQRKYKLFYFSNNLMKKRQIVAFWLWLERHLQIPHK